MSEHYGDIYVATALRGAGDDGGPGQAAAVALLLAPFGRPTRTLVNVTHKPTTNPQAVAFGVLWALAVLGERWWGTIRTNLKAAEMDVPRAIRRAGSCPPIDPACREFPVLMDRVAGRIAASLKTEVVWIANNQPSQHFQTARNAALRALREDPPRESPPKDHP